MSKRFPTSLKLRGAGEALFGDDEIGRLVAFKMQVGIRGNVLSEGEYINVRERLQSLMLRANSFLCTILSEVARADQSDKWMRDNV